MPEGLDRLSELRINVRSKILEQLQSSLENPATLAAGTQYVKSDGTNYGMYTKSDPQRLTDIWQVVVNPAAQLGRSIEHVAAPESPQG
ncbi:hypothetical protein [Mycobacterium intracellulare]|uniref:hypothetical protein n=1 Tax=Mycobacterium intracellulare TaxID=1767 RepID=UPI001155D87B|nr:hypothetical protein [Mycobacterium intracellulare]